jgi:hypothetical protein
MGEVAMVCPKCQGAMIQGFVAELTHGSAEVESWADGPPKKHWLVGVKVPVMGRLPIATFRCESCGFLESYARKEFAAK